LPAAALFAWVASRCPPTTFRAPTLVVRIRDDDLVADRPQDPRQFALLGGPPTSLAADDHQGLRLERPQQRLALVPAQIQLDRSLERSLTAPVCEIEEALLGIIGQRLAAR